MLKKRLKIVRPTISPDTIRRAWEVEDYVEASDALQLVLRIAKEIKEEDDRRIRRLEDILDTEYRIHA